MSGERRSEKKRQCVAQWRTHGCCPSLDRARLSCMGSRWKRRSMTGSAPPFICSPLASLRRVTASPPQRVTSLPTTPYDVHCGRGDACARGRGGATARPSTSWRAQSRTWSRGPRRARATTCRCRPMQTRVEWQNASRLSGEALPWHHLAAARCRRPHLHNLNVVARLEGDAKAEHGRRVVQVSVVPHIGLDGEEDVARLRAAGKVTKRRGRGVSQAAVTFNRARAPGEAPQRTQSLLSHGRLMRNAVKRLVITCDC